jgi:NAD(P)-dependent dehydrogenase (short-subunit alcohol dehydrogenase family)
MTASTVNETSPMPARSLNNRVCVITGSTSGIGRGIADYFAQLGAKVLVHGRNADRGAQVVDHIRSAGGDAEFAQADLSDEAACRGLIRRAVERFGQIDVLVNNAADTSRGTVESTPLALWDAIFATNVRAPFILMQEAVAHMKPRRTGSIVNIGSVNAYIGEPKLCAYSASKGGLMTLTKNAASFLNQYRIRVNQLNVGWTLTEGEDRVKRESEGKGDDWLEEAVRTRPFGRLLLPQDVAYAAAYFASDESAVVTGSVLDLEQYPVGAPPNW